MGCCDDAGKAVDGRCSQVGVGEMEDSRWIGCFLFFFLLISILANQGWLIAVVEYGSEDVRGEYVNIELVSREKLWVMRNTWTVVCILHIGLLL